MAISSPPTNARMTTTTLVVGATGATGRHLVLQLLQQQQNVRAIARSKERLLHSLDEIAPDTTRDPNVASRLDVTEASILDLGPSELEGITSGCDAVVSCLGHNLNFKGVYRDPHRLVTESARRLTRAIEANDGGRAPGGRPTKFILMGSDGVANPAGGDDRRKRGDRVALTLLRHLLPPHRDNERAAAYVSDMGASAPGIEWTVVRPTDLINGEKTDYELFDRPQKGLFDGAKGGIATRATVAGFMGDLIMKDELWNDWKYKMPVLHDAARDVVCA